MGGREGGGEEGSLLRSIRRKEMEEGFFMGARGLYSGRIGIVKEGGREVVSM